MTKKAKKTSKPTKTRSKLTPEQRKQIAQMMQIAVNQHRQGQLQQAESLYRKVLSIDPSHLDAMQFLASIAQQTGHLAPALQLFEQVVKIDPSRYQIHFSLGKLYAQVGRQNEAVGAYKTCVKLKPGLIEGWNNLGLLHKESHQYAKAIHCFQKVVKQQPENGLCWSNLGNAYKDSGQMDEAVKALKKASEVQHGLSAAYSNYLLALNYLPDISKQDVADAHLAWHRYVPKSVQASRFDFEAPRYVQGKKLRIGYVSPDLHRHSVAFFLLSVFEHHTTDCELYVYDCNDKKDTVNQKLRRFASQWREVKHASDTDLANLIYEDKVDILVDLCGHMANNRLTVFLQKPAPVQVTWLGYPNTSGLAQMDYRITDAIADPQGDSDRLHSEELMRLESGFLCYQGDDSVSASLSSPVTKGKPFTFGSFNNTVKMTEQVIATWARILLEVSDSRLLLKSAQLESAELRERVVALFQKAGIGEERLILCGLIAETDSHLKKYDEVDLALDTFPYNGTTTTCEAMWMGVPTLCLKGDTHAARVGASLMHRVGLDDFVVNTEEDYIAKAVELARAPDALAQLRPTLRARMQASRLCDGKGFVSELETALRRIWQKACTAKAGQ